jgi:protein-S-isoprenylcysteine O-methyltransferase Ste14
MSLVVRNLLFTIAVPGLGGALVPWWILTRGGITTPAAWEALPVIAAGVALYLWCVWNFAAVGRGTPGPWDAPRRVVATGPYRWVRNPIYLAALLIVLGEAWLFLSPALLGYAAAIAVCFHLFVTGYEEPTLRRRLAAPTWSTSARSRAGSPAGHATVRSRSRGAPDAVGKGDEVHPRQRLVRPRAGGGAAVAAGRHGLRRAPPAWWRPSGERRPGARSTPGKTSGPTRGVAAFRAGPPGP